MSALSGKRIGFAMTGSFCTLRRVLAVLERLAATGAEITPILSYTASSFDTRFMKAEELKSELLRITGREPIDTLTGAEPIGPKALLDLVIVAPCTGNTVAKLATGISDTPVTLAVKAHLRNERPILIAVSSNDALSANAKNIGLLMNTRNVYLVPMGQDDCERKKSSAVAEMELIPEAAEAALGGRQLQPEIR